MPCNIQCIAKHFVMKNTAWVHHSYTTMKPTRYDKTTPNRAMDGECERRQKGKHSLGENHAHCPYMYVVCTLYTYNCSRFLTYSVHKSVTWR